MPTATALRLLRVWRNLRPAHARAARGRRRFAPGGALRPLEERLCLSAAAPYKVPLELVNVAKPGSGAKEYKLGIYVGIGGGAPKLYEFDTGGKGFWASYASNPRGGQWWGAYRQTGVRNLNITYSSGNQFLATKVSGSVQLYREDSPGHYSMVVETVGDVDMAQIVRYTDLRDAKKAARWNADLRKGAPPLERDFYGDFGASLEPIGATARGTIYSVLPQIPMPEGLTPGFIVHVGALGDGTQPYLQIGLTDQDLQAFDTTLPMNRDTQAGQTRYPVTGVPTYSEQVANADVSWRDPKTGLVQRYHDVGWTLDTGAPPVTVWQGSRISVHPSFLRKPSRSQGYAVGAFKNGLAFEVHAAPLNPSTPEVRLSIDPTGSSPGVDAVQTSYHSTGTMGQNYVNTGILTFTRYDVMFDLRDGLVGFRPADEPLP